MRWIAKALVQKVISILPQPDRWNYVFQRRVTRGFPRTDQDFSAKLDWAVRQLAVLRENPALEIPASQFYEFGAGWDLIQPLAYHALGVERQTVVDIRPNVRLELVNDAIRRVGPLLERMGHPPERRFDTAPLSSSDELERRFEIRYLAPADARATGLGNDSIDVITSTETLEHIPAPDVAAILRESARILRPEGLWSGVIDMQDHYSFFDPHINVYNYLRYSDRVWRLINSDVHYQNRLRNSDYLSLAGESGLELVLERRGPVSDEDLEALAGIPLAPRFRAYEREDLAIKWTLIVLRKPR